MKHDWKKSALEGFAASFVLVTVCATLAGGCSSSDINVNDGPQKVAMDAAAEKDIPNLEKEIAKFSKAALSSTDAENDSLPLVTIYGLCAKYKMSMRAVAEFRMLIPKLDESDPTSGTVARVLLVTSLVDNGDVEQGLRESEAWEQDIEMGRAPRFAGIQMQVAKAKSVVAQGYERAEKWGQAAKVWEPLVRDGLVRHGGSLEAGAHLVDCLEHEGDDQRAQALIAQVEEVAARAPSEGIWTHVAHVEVVKARIFVKEGNRADAVAICTAIVRDPKYDENTPESMHWIKQARKLLSIIHKEAGVPAAKTGKKQGAGADDAE